MNQKLWTKLLASLLVITLTFANFILLGVYATNSYATVDNLERQETVTNNENVTFNAYFKDEKGNNTHTIRQNIEKQDLKLYVAISVKKGYLKNAKVQILGENGTNSNIKLKNSNEVLEYIEKMDNEAGIISLKQINSGTQVVLEIPVVATKEDNYDLSNFSKLNDIVLTGSYMGDAGKEIAIQKTIQTRNEWVGTITPVLEQQLLRFIPYQVGEKTGTILQTILTSGIQNNSLPIKETTIMVTVPKVNGKNPEKVNVIANKALITNGKKVEEFNQENWTYDVETGIVTIQVQNEAVENKVSWVKQGQDEFILTYLFDEKVDTIETTQKAESRIKAYNSEETNGTQNKELAISQQEVLGQIVTGSISTTDAISKGYLYTKTQKETTYDQEIKVDIAYPELVDELTLLQDMDYFVNEKEEVLPTTISNTNYAYYKTTKIRKENFEKILGEDGTLTISTLAGEVLATFDKTVEPDENGEYVFSYEKEVNQIVITTSKPIATGKLELVHKKALKGNTDYTKPQVESFKTLKQKVNIEAKAQKVSISKVEKEANTSLVAPSTKLEAQVSNQNLSTVLTNENVELRVILKTNDITCDLYKNPSIEIVLPNYISKLDIKDINLLFHNGLSIKDYKTYVNNNGNIVIQVNIEGEQATYSSDEISKGTNLIINTNITLKQLTPTTNDVIKVYATNELVTTYEAQDKQVANKGYTEVALKAVAPVGMVTTNAISGYNAKNETVTSMSSQEQTGILDVKKEAKTAKVNMNVINNYENNVNNVSILGRIPTKGSTNADTKEDLGSNLETNIASGITVNGVENEKVNVYYSTNPEATKDLNETSNAWTTTPENLENVKSYLVDVDSNMETGSTLNMSYDLAIPENIEYNQEAYANYAVYFDNQKPEGTIQEKAVATKVGVASGDGPDLAVSIKADIANGANVKEGDTITYTVTVKNNGKSEVKNITLKGNIPEGTVYVEPGDNTQGEGGTDSTIDENRKEYVQLIDMLAVGEEKTITYQVEVDELEEVEIDENGNEIIDDDDEYIEGDHEDSEEDDGEETDESASFIKKERDIIAYASATVENYDITFTSEQIVNRATKGWLKVLMEASPVPATSIRMEEDVVEYQIEIQNVNDEVKENVIVTYVLPEGMEFVETNQNGTYNASSKTVTWNFDTIDGYQMKIIALKTKINQFANNEFEKTYDNKVVVKTANNEQESNTVTIKAQKSFLTINQTTDTKSTVAVGDTITYNLEIVNRGAGNAYNVQIIDEIPEGVIYLGSQYIVKGTTYDSKLGTTKVAITVPTIGAGETVDVKIQVKVKDLTDGQTEKEIANIIKVSASDMEELTSNTITHKVVKSGASINDDPSIDTIIEGTNKISGIAWLDENGDGKRDDNERRLSNIEVMLINAENGQIVVDPITKRNKVQNTNAYGEYTFANIQKGQYMVVFLYDSGNYEITTYQKEGINTNKNSDVISMKVNLYGEDKLAAVSDKLQITGANIDNIDMGLIQSKKFDLKLDKVISKITLNNNNGTSVQEYKDSKAAKLDIPSKLVDSSSIIIEYKIRVTNEGGVAGYAKKIVDYLPADMKFSSELNKDWYTGNNGTSLYNASLANTLINPGETKEVTLLLTKNITKDNMGIIHNTAEIYESHNDLGLADIDSNVANKVQTEDDFSFADAIIGTKTGEVYIISILSVIVIAIFGVGIYIIKKKILPRV